MSKYDITKIKRCHWNELMKVFNLPEDYELDVNVLTLGKFLMKNSQGNDAKAIADVLRLYLLKISINNPTDEADIYKTIAKCESDFTVIKWFANNIRSFYN